MVAQRSDRLLMLGVWVAIADANNYRAKSVALLLAGRKHGGHQSDLAGIDLALCRRLPWLDNAYDPVVRLRLYVPSSLIGCVGVWPGFGLDAIFADRADALQYQATMSLRLWSPLPGAG
jgi:hypothetical protein